MPVHVAGNTEGRMNFDFGSTDYNYDYPEDLDLKPGSELHGRIVNRVLDRARQSYNEMSKRHSSWNKIDESLTAYIPTDEAEKKLQEHDSRKPVSIVVPYSFATMETLMSYLVAVFLNDPILQYRGVGTDDIIGAKALQLVVNQQAHRRKLALHLHTMFRDCLGYGLGPVVASWDTSITKKEVKQPQGMFDFFGRFKQNGYQRKTVDTVSFEGNELKNIDPYNVLPDPTVSISDIQSGEFFGWIENTNLMDLLSQEQVDPDNYFNGKYVKQMGKEARTNITVRDASGRERKHGGRTEPTGVKHYVDTISMYIKLIPAEWKLGDSEYPEIWFFTIAGDNVVIEARQLGLNHGMIPATIAAPDYDGYSATPTSRMEIIYGMQHTIDWLFSSHITNVRKAINDMLIVDPYLVNIQDLEDPEPGKLIRMRRAAWGQNKVKDAIHQLQVNDITRGHIADSSYLMDLMNRVSGASDGVQGIQNRSGERVSATEARGTQRSALNRLERLAKIISIQAMQDIGYFFAVHTQQLMEEETFVNIAGNHVEELTTQYGNNSRMKVTPYDLLVDFDVELKDGLNPAGGFPEIWTQLFQTIMQNPELGQEFDATRIFKHIAQGLGARDINQFVVSPQTVPDGMAAEELRKGNIVPLQEVANNGQGN